MYVYLRGVLDDGSLRAASVPRDTATTVSLERYADATLVLEVHRNNGVPVDLRAARDFTAPTFRLAFGESVLGCVGTAVIASYMGTVDTGRGKNFLTFTIPAADYKTKLLKDRYFFEIVLISGVARYKLLAPSVALIRPGLILP